MKKLLMTLLIVAMAVTGLFAGPARFVFAGLDQHPEILVGFLPTYLLLGAGYDAEFVEGNTSEFQLLVGAGYKQRRVWQDADTGFYPEYPDPDTTYTYDVIQTDYMLRYNQGFMDDLLTLRLGWEMKYEENLDSFKGEKNPSLSAMGIGPDYMGEVYPDLRGDKRFYGNVLAARLTFDMMEDDLVRNDGFKMYLDAQWAPYALNSALDGKADFYSLSANAVGAVTLYVFNSNEKDWFSLVLADRINASWTDGTEIPVWAQGPVSLGRKVRGYNTYTYNTQFTVVNNLDLRLAGPGLGIGGIRPRINFFLDMGYGCGEYFNMPSGQKGNNFLASTGVQLTMSFFDFIDLGYQMSCIFTGEKYSDPGKGFVTSFTFFLDF